MAAGALLVLLGSCGPRVREPVGDERQIVSAVLSLLASDGRPVCLDNHTKGDSLSVYREMAKAPRPSRQMLNWFPPTPLRPVERLTTKDLSGAELRNERVIVSEPAPRRDVLPPLRQFELNGTAGRLAATLLIDAETSVRIAQRWAPKGVTARWWPRNRLDRGCWPLYLVSNPVRDREAAFVVVRAEHWGTLYALERKGSSWMPVAEWSRWLY